MAGASRALLVRARLRLSGLEEAPVALAGALIAQWRRSARDEPGQARGRSDRRGGHVALLRWRCGDTERDGLAAIGQHHLLAADRLHGPARLDRVADRVRLLLSVDGEQRLRMRT